MRDSTLGKPHRGIRQESKIRSSERRSSPAAEEPERTESDVIEFARTTLTAYKVPRQAVFVSDLPGTPVAKCCGGNCETGW